MNYVVVVLTGGVFVALPIILATYAGLKRIIAVTKRQSTAKAIAKYYNTRDNGKLN